MGRRNRSARKNCLENSRLEIKKINLQEINIAQPLQNQHNTSMAGIAYYGKDDRIKIILESFFKSRKEDANEVHTFTQIIEEKKFEEAMVNIKFDVVIVEQALVPPPVPDWAGFFKKKFPLNDVPLILVGEEREPLKILKYLESGYIDYIVNPPDKPLLIEKISMYATGKRSSDIRQVYSLQLSQHADVAKPGHIEELSEFDCKVRTVIPFKESELLLLYSKAFGVDMNANGSVLARCYKTEEHTGFKGQHLNHFYFCGVTTDILVNIRNALRKTYAAGKNR